MTDRELLELAARAAGISYRWSSEHGFINAIQDCKWNPLLSDSDAFRLAVKLGLHLTNSQADAWATHLTVTAIEPIFGNPYAATRRAIVRAAAEIGRAMKEADHA